VPRLSAARALVLSWAVRTALLLFWSLVAWGALLVVSSILQSGPGALAGLLLPPRHSFWAWLNAAAAALAVAVGLAGVGAALWLRRGRGEPPAA
jgi:hypothetical protein